ncbi:carbamoyltransferase C-terminal domain-containing protein [Nonomuraea sp. NPDC023979]|uniref:carbamoyltransferase family protein n=1 Tax=Nonomuraea sp. NPDC023979 TaxID=3154796 RepID=UPI0033C5219E
MIEVSSHVVLGVCSFTHDSAAALLVDGELVGFVEEERLSGIKHTRAFPEEAVGWLLNAADVTAEQVNAVAYNFHGLHYLRAAATSLGLIATPAARGRAVARAASFAKVGLRTLRRVRSLGLRFPRARVQPVLHHRTHQMYSFAASGWDRAAVLVVDSLGEAQTTTVAVGLQSGGGLPVLHTVHAIRDPASLGYAYGAVTEHLGWRRGDEEGTVMALAALGDPARFRRLFARAIPVTDTGFALHPEYFAPRVLSSAYTRLTPRFAAETCPRRAPEDPVTQVHQDLAAALQERTEVVMLHLAALTKTRTGMRRLCLGGGVATNCVAVGKVVESGLFEEVFVPPAPGDAGTAIGAAAAVYVQSNSRPVSGVAGRCYLGPAYPDWSPDLSSWPGTTARQIGSDIADALAERLAAGQIIGVFRGRIEVGPRALGNRSILASPLSAGVVARLNDTVKFREPFRPFAPMVMAERAADYFTLGQEAPFMSMASGVTDLARDRIPAVVHANGTARVQTVHKDGNPFMYAVLSAFAQHTGIPVLINTSLNVKGKPMCGTPAMALDCLANSGLDALLLESWWVTS